MRYHRDSVVRLLQSAAVSRTIRAVRAILLARLLDPSAFGAFALIGALIGPLLAFSNVGLTGAIAREAESTAETVGTARWMSRWMTVVTALVLSVAVAAWTNVFGSPRLLGPGLVVALATSLYLLPQPELGLLQQRKQFKTLARLEIAFDVVWTCGAVAVALISRSVWALAVGELTAQVARLAMATHMAGTPAPARKDPLEFKRLLRFAAGSLPGTILYSLAASMPTLLLQRHCADASIGVFSVASTYSQFAALTFAGAASRVLLPELSRVAPPERLGLAWKYAEGLAAVLAPATGLIAVAGSPVLVVLLGDRWSGASLPLAILAWAVGVRVAFPLNLLGIAANRPILDAVVAGAMLCCYALAEVVLGWTSPARGAYYVLVTDVLVSGAAAWLAHWLWGPTSGRHRLALTLWLIAALTAAASWAIPMPQSLLLMGAIRGVAFCAVFAAVVLVFPPLRRRYVEEARRSMAVLRSQILSL